MKRLFISLLIGISCLCVTVPGYTQDAQEILLQVDQRMNPGTCEMYRKLINIEPNGTQKEFVLYTLKKGRDKMAAMFLSPSSEKGRATLRLGDNMWLYIPNVGKPLRITSLQSVIGGIFNNSDILQLDYHIEYDAIRITDREDTYLLELKAKTPAVAYDRLKMVVDKQTILPLTIECFTNSGMLIKTLRYSKIKSYEGGITRPSMLETDSPLNKGYKSVMLFAKIRPKQIDDAVFSLNFMSRLDELRQ